MSRIKVSVASPPMAAEVAIGPGEAADGGDLDHALTAAGVAAGVDEALLARLRAGLASADFAFRGAIAGGRLPRPGTDGCVVASFRPGPVAGTEAADGSVDYHERSLLHSVAEGDVVARHVPPDAGLAGVDVRGRALPPPPVRDVLPKLGPGVAARGDGAFVATRAGVVHFVAGKALDVLPLYQHRGDVDLSSGNLQTHGSLQVSGDVREGCAAQAAGDVAIGGAVLDATVVAGGHATIAQSIQGQASVVRAGGDLTCRHATGATLVAAGRVRFGDHVAHCRVQGEAIELLTGRGAVVGGELRARRWVAVLQAGTAAGAATLLSAADLSDERSALVRLQKEADLLERRAQHGGSPKHDRGGKLGRALVGAGDRAQRERLGLLQRERELLTDARIKIGRSAHPGVRVQLGSASHVIEEPACGVVFRWDAARQAIVQEGL